MLSTDRARARAALLALAVCGCAANTGDVAEPVISLEPGPEMRPGENCLRCHNPAGPAARRPWSAAGTVFPARDAMRTEGVLGVRVELSDADGNVIDRLITNEVGNFYTNAELPDPFFVALEYDGQRVEMPCAPPAGSCNACHALPPVGHAPGRIYVPGAHPEAGPFDCDDWEAGGPGRAPTNAR